MHKLEHIWVKIPDNLINKVLVKTCSMSFVNESNQKALKSVFRLTLISLKEFGFS